MASSPYLTDRAMGVWGPRAYTWTGEAPPRVLGYPYEPSGRQRTPGSPPGPRPPRRYQWLRALAHRHPHWPGHGHQPGTGQG